MATHQTAKTQYIQAGDISFAYRRFGPKDKNDLVPLLFLHHFRASMDWWDPLLINSVAAHRPVILFDNAGVGKSTGKVDATIKEMAKHAVEFLGALGVSEVDLLGFSMGGMVAQMVALDAAKGPVRRLIIAGSGPSWGADLQPNSEQRSKEVNENAAGAEATLQNMQKLFFYDSDTSLKAGAAYWSRIHERTEHTSGEPRSELVSWNYADGGEGLQSMAAALAAWGDEENRKKGSYDRLGEIGVPTMILQGKDDFMIPTVNSFVMQQRMGDARLVVWPDSGHGSCFNLRRRRRGRWYGFWGEGCWL